MCLCLKSQCENVNVSSIEFCRFNLVFFFVFFSSILHILIHIKRDWKHEFVMIVHLLFIFTVIKKEVNTATKMKNYRSLEPRSSKVEGCRLFCSDCSTTIFSPKGECSLVSWWRNVNLVYDTWGPVPKEEGFYTEILPTVHYLCRSKCHCHLRICDQNVLFSSVLHERMSL